MAEFRVTVDLSGVPALAGIINAQVFPLLSQAVRAVSQQTQINWIEAVQRAKLWSGERDVYAKSIDLKETGPFAALVWSDYKYASEIDEGRPAYDLKKMLDTSQKVRRTKDGRRYLIIPIRHNSPGNDALAPAMPTSVYSLASQLKASIVTGMTERPSGEIASLHSKWGMKTLKKQTPFLSNPATRGPMMVPKMITKWGGRLPSSGPGDRYGGMVRMEASTPNSRSSVYLTFRTMMEGSPGWIVKAQAGQHLVQTVVTTMQPLAEAAFREAVTRLR